MKEQLLYKAMKAGLDIINPLQEFLTEDGGIIGYATQYGIEIHDIRKPKPKNEWKLFTGEILKITTRLLQY